ncbi:MAG: HAD-IA family hydrolase [Planctomycetes bacterium]|nr:HAD-IA family hydrolase [Planctomycetota bacterium]
MANTNDALLRGVEAVLFDAVGTLIYPHPPAVEVYQRFGRVHGAELTREDVEQRFGAAFRSVFSGAETETSEELERRRWRDVVAGVFRELPPAAIEPLFGELWSHFAMSESWRLYPEVADVWRRLQARGYRLGVASNYDDRLPRVLAGLPPLAACRDVFWSSQLGYNKPDPRFFAAIAERMNLPPEKLLLIGDDPKNDIQAARRAGWNSIHLHRTGDRPPEGAIADLNHAVLSRRFPRRL